MDEIKAIVTITIAPEQVKKEALDMLYKAQKSNRISIHHAETRHARQEELENLWKKARAIDWLIGVALKEA